MFTTIVTGALTHLETPIREALLKPLNYNPHPYAHHQQQSAIDVNYNEHNYVQHPVYSVNVVDNPLPGRHAANHLYR